ncbi:HAD-IC family P-type ATPase [Enterococcus malodoratus]|uniref:Calcium-translocating P-type ATPase, PMCA-type n=1 Tax=Enterococcus malodoratus ATCC 43197 TaxID=1158601 RepID=R2QVN1_9ENTE|nr:HAD-IC family P-type ATPase [Enterococcus malodoratus]EOH72541.1 calcium-translocating P-type ATPase, PMCA-type [Enterococcus malodoratus ATCC 43197]EOT70133.1 calcium-translocating P-type ATPase, PMCA-type [Enterococcus malodoratus ATCC 43197]OJG66336.1 calcium-translocating P-type ATPase, PMCA-type [Enterococcus malodoratus]SPW74744.1 ATPase, P-type (transporting), HAD superfamily, subfamily IC [Enterococcus malodoratus]STD65345.1 ATPase, P-type (transporting), HAD superfamily, subfamily 
MKWYKLSTEDILHKVASQTTGLTKEQRSARLKNNGPNKMEEKEQVKLWRKIAKHFTDLLMVVLIVAAVLKFATGEAVEGGIIFLVVIVNGFVGYWQERKAEESLDGLKQMMGQEATVLNEGQPLKLDSEELVQGDVVILKAGDVIPADLRLIEVHDLTVEESILTGESEAVEKTVEVISQEAMAGDQLNMAFSGTLVQTGSARGLVVETGDATEIGKINHALQSIQTQTTPLVKKMHQLNKQIFRGILALIVFLLFFTSFRYGMDWSLMFSASIALIVAMIPEGLPAVLTMILSMGVKEMADENAIIKGMPAVETLGSMTVICSDKTGTLTKNEMTVQEVVTEELPLVKEIMNNCQELKTKDDQKIEEIHGNPTELALLNYVAEEEQQLKPVLAKIPFSSSYKYMATMHAEGEDQIIFVKGAPEVLLEKADATNEEKARWEQRGLELASKGQRVLGFGYKKVSATELTHELLSGLTFAGLAGIIDPPKESAVRAVEQAQQAGISVKMITGDHKATAQAISKQIGLKHTSKILEGADIDSMSDEELVEVVGKVDVYARTTPDHKLRIVTALQKKEEIVGMTGDGVNDAPALKQADIGIAMGIKGSEVSKQAADMVLADDNFYTIVKAVKEGRRIFDNLQKTINFFLPTALAQGLIVILALLMNRPLPLTPIQILWVNMVTTITLSYALGFEKANRDTMKRPPRDTKMGILLGYSFFRILYVSLLIMIPAYFLSMHFEGTALQQTILLQSIVLGQAVYMINCREMFDPAINRRFFENKFLFISLGILFVLQMGVVFLPLGQQLIGTTALSLAQQLVILGNALLLFLVVEIEKRVSKGIFKRKEKAVSHYQND